VGEFSRSVYNRRIGKNILVFPYKTLMAMISLNPEEREVIRRTMDATFRYFEFDFHARLGVSPETMRALLSVWPSIDDTHDDSDACVAINNSLNDLLHGVGISDENAVEFVGVGREEMLRVYRKWSAARGWTSTGVQ
jgi:hypothetical protein